LVVDAVALEPVSMRFSLRTGKTAVKFAPLDAGLTIFAADFAHVSELRRDPNREFFHEEQGNLRRRAANAVRAALSEICCLAEETLTLRRRVMILEAHRTSAVGHVLVGRRAGISKAGV
jgi:hypothetical protein